MRISFVSVAVLATCAVAVSFRGLRRPGPERVAAPMAHEQGAEVLGSRPVAFVPNLGQWEHPARYVARVGAMAVFLERTGWSFTLVERRATKQERRDRCGSLDRVDEKPARGVAVRMTFAHGRQPELIAEERLPGVHNYFLGNDPSKWRSDVPLWGAVRYRELYNGVDVRAREHDGHFEYDVLLQPGAGLGPVEIVVEGIDRMHLDEQGALVMDTRLGPVRMPVPLSWEEGASGEKRPVACRYELRGADRFGFEVSGRRPGSALVVDPGVVWSTFLGGTNDEVVSAMAIDAQGATIAGSTASTDFPTTPGAFDTSFDGGASSAGGDAFVTRLSPAGSSLVWSTFLGGAGKERSIDIALDAQGAVTIAGVTDSPDFPTTPLAFDTSYNGVWDAFVARLSPTGSTLDHATFLGGTREEAVRAIAVDAQGAAIVAGSTRSTNFPTTPGASDTSHNGGYPYGYDAFVTRLSPTGSSLVDSTFLGGTRDDAASDLVLDAQGAVLVAGWTLSADFPTTPGAFDTSYSGGIHEGDAFVTWFSPAGSTLACSTFLGGSTDDVATALALDAQGAVTVAGYTDSPDFPTTPGALDTSYNPGLFSGTRNAFVSRLSPTGSTVVYSTYLGEAGDLAWAVAVDAQGVATVAGDTGSANFPTTPGAFDTSFNGLRDVFVSRLSLTGSTLVYSTFLGGANKEVAAAVALDAAGVATVAGCTLSNDFPTSAGAFATSFGGSADGFVTSLDVSVPGIASWGGSSPGCNGPLPISVSSMPQAGNAGFAVICGNAAPGSLGLVAFGGALVNPIPVLGVDLWIDPAALFTTASVFSNAIGTCEVPLPIPADPALAGFRFFAQFVWFGPAAPPPCPVLGLSATNALDITIQP